MLNVDMLLLLLPSFNLSSLEQFSAVADVSSDIKPFKKTQNQHEHVTRFESRISDALTKSQPGWHLAHRKAIANTAEQ